MNPAGTTFEIVDEQFADENDTVEFIGRTAGWSRAEVTADNCENIPFENVLLLCVAVAEVTSGDDAAGGDSGAPVFIVDSGSDVDLTGLLFGRDPEDSSMFGFAHIGYVYFDLGGSWDVCETGC